MKTQHCQLYKQNSISGRLKLPLHCIIHSELITQERVQSRCPVVTAIGQIRSDMNSSTSSWSGSVIINLGHTTKHKPPYRGTKETHVYSKITFELQYIVRSALFLERFNIQYTSLFLLKENNCFGLQMLETYLHYIPPTTPQKKTPTGSFYTK